ncbi:MAG: hypothetical protein SGJ17_12210 [Hyphomicrobiales bacterium]|nr:hypothetical protein [Hyphomicrobiales bacterium]
MPHVLAGTLVLAGVYYAYKWMQRETLRVDERMRKAERRVKRRRTGSVAEAINLRLDPSTGIYLPAAE